VSEAVNGEQKQFEIRRQGRAGQRSQLKERVAQLHEEIAGYGSPIESKIKQVEWITKELEDVNKLWLKNLIPYTRVTSLER
jgi:HlyD family secretion protein